jgi:hypothetical protein
MNIPEGHTEEQVLASIEVIVKGLAHKFKFGYHETDDMAQEARYECIKALDKYEPEKGKLETFLWTHTKNRLSNLKRNKYERYDKPCLNCPLNAYDPDCLKSDNECTAYDDKNDCKPYYNWLNRNSAKKNIMSPIGIGQVKDENESNMRQENCPVDKIHSQSIINLLDEKIPVNLRSSWIKMKNDIRLNKPEREKLLSAIREIMAEENYDS